LKQRHQNQSDIFKYKLSFIKGQSHILITIATKYGGYIRIEPIQSEAC